MNEQLDLIDYINNLSSDNKKNETTSNNNSVKLDPNDLLKTFNNVQPLSNDSFDGYKKLYELLNDNSNKSNK